VCICGKKPTFADFARAVVSVLNFRGQQKILTGFNVCLGIMVYGNGRFKNFVVLFCSKNPMF
jgi:hypothetical protein